jgi:hypothetical protein
LQSTDGFRCNAVDSGHAQGQSTIEEEKAMKYAGLLVMPAGFFLTLAALVLFPDPTRRAVFVICGLAVEGMGLAVAVRGHMLPRGTSRP